MKEKFNKISTWLGRRGGLIVLVAIVEICVYLTLSKFNSGFEFLHNQETRIAILKGNGIWTLITLMISAPIAFFIWKFRDENAVYQLENQRKDINLKEFHKISEWVSGLHLVEDKITEKNKLSVSEEGKDINELLEKNREYGEVAFNRLLPTLSRQDGAVGLQIAAVYMLKPFYCGEHGDTFRRPALNLLTGAWLALFKPIENNKSKEEKEKLAKSPLAIALTEIIFADGGKHLKLHPDLLPNLYLSNLNMNIANLDKSSTTIFKMNCVGIQLEGANLWDVDLSKANLSKANLAKANLMRADLTKADLSEANLSEARLARSNLTDTDLSEAILFDIQSMGGCVGEPILSGAKVRDSDLSRHDLLKRNESKLLIVVIDESGHQGFSGVLFCSNQKHNFGFSWDCTGDEKINLTGTIERNKEYWDITFEPDYTDYS